MEGAVPNWNWGYFLPLLEFDLPTPPPSIFDKEGESRHAHAISGLHSLIAPEEFLRLCETWRIELLANLFNIFNLLIISAKNINMDVHGVLKASLCSLRLYVLDSAENFKIAGLLQVIEL